MEQENIQNLPAFNGSFEENIAVIFENPPKVGKRYFLPQNSLIDAAIVTGVRPHYHDTVFFGGKPLDLAQTVLIDGVSYDVLPLADFKNVLLTLATKKNSKKVERMPLGTLLVLPESPALGTREAAPKARKAFYISVSSRQCFIEFTAAPASRRFVVFISFNYTLRKI